MTTPPGDNPNGRKDENNKRREEWLFTAKLFLLVIAIFGTVIFLALWQ